MPYVRQKTWLPLAPRIRGLSLRESPYGMGQAPCPSIEQLMGISDPSDPCQTGGSGATISQQIQNLPTTQASLPNSDLLSVNAAGQPTSPAYPATATLSQFLQNNGSTILLAGAGLFGIALISGMKKR